MPNFDKTGPVGEGAKTGRGLGSCDNSSPNFLNQMGMGRGRGMGRGGRCCGRNFFSNADISLEDQEKILKKNLEAIRKLKDNANNKK